MKTIKVFISSSEESKTKRLEFTDTIQELNSLFEPRGIEFELEKWECTGSSMGQSHGWDICDDFAKGEQDIAYSKLYAVSGMQKLYIRFEDSDSLTSERQEIKDSFSIEYGEFFCDVKNTDTLRLCFILQIECYLNSIGFHDEFISIMDSRIGVERTPFADFRKVVFATNNPEYLKLLGETKELEKRLRTNKRDESLRYEFKKRTEDLHSMERCLLQVSRCITEISDDTDTSRLARAIQLFERGDCSGANAMLDFKEISVELKTNIERFDTLPERREEAQRSIEKNIDELLLKVSLLKKEKNKESVDEILSIYDKAIGSARNRVNDVKFARLLREYYLFLEKEQWKYSLAKEVRNESRELFRSIARRDDSYTSELADILSNIDNVYDISDDDDIEREYLEALEIYRCLAKTSEFYRSKVARKLYDLGVLCYFSYKWELMEEVSREALELFRPLYNQAPISYGTYLYSICTTMARLHNERYEFEQAESICKEAVEICRKLAIHDPIEHKDREASMLNVLGDIHANVKLFHLAEEDYRSVLEAYRQIEDADSLYYQSQSALTLHKLAKIHKEVQRFDLAEEEYRETLGISRQLLKVDNYGSRKFDMADALYSLASLHRLTREFGLAEKEYREALKIYRQEIENYELEMILTRYQLASMHKEMNLIEESEKEYKRAEIEFKKKLMSERLSQKDSCEDYPEGIIDIVYNLAHLHGEMQKFEEAENEYNEVLEQHRLLAKQCPLLFEMRMAETLNHLANIHRALQRYDEAEREYYEALAIYRLYTKRVPVVHEPYLASILLDIAQLHQTTQKFDIAEAEKECTEALGIYRRLVEIAPKVYSPYLERADNIMGTIHEANDEPVEDN